VSTVKLSVELAPVLFAESLQTAFHVWKPSAVVALTTTGTPFGTDALDPISDPSRKRAQLIVGAMLSVAVKLNITVDELRSAPGAGALRATVGGAVSTVKVLVALVFELPESSTQVTFQVLVPLVKPETVVVVGEPLGDGTFVALATPSIVRLHTRLGSRLSVAVQLNVNDVDDVLR
jgi:hypothetical protein